MSNRISPEHMAEIKAMTRGVLPSQLLGHIAALEAENERLTKALNDCIEIFVAFDTDTERVIAIEHTVNAALAALDKEMGE
jgi:hypothetical protein